MNFLKPNSTVLVLLLLCTIIVFDSCKDDPEEFTPETTQETRDEAQIQEQNLIVDLTLYDPAVEEVVASVTGLITDENNLPLEGANIILGENEYLTDSNGRFIALEVTLNGLGSVYSVHKEGYFKGIRRFYPRENELSQTKVQLLEKQPIGSFDASTGGSLNSEGGVSINFPEYSIVDEQGNLVVGDVDVSSYWIDPTKPEVANQLPGGLLGLNGNIEEVSLVSYSMAAIELSSSGQEVNIAPNKTVKIEFPIPTSLIEDAPEEIALWSLNEEFGIWVEEGIAINHGNKYVGEVAHFSFWNCDQPFPLIEVSGSLEDTNGNPLSGVQVFANVVNSGLSASAISNSQGVFSGKLPLGELINLQIIGSCLSHSVQIGPYNSDIVFDPIVVTDVISVPFSGIALDCGGSPLNNGFVEVETQGGNAIVLPNNFGEFSGLTMTCDSNEIAQVWLYDFENLNQSSSNASLENGEYIFGEVSACENLTNYLTVSINDSIVSSIDFTITSEPWGPLRIHKTWDDGSNFNLSFLDANPNSQHHGLELNTPVSSFHHFHFGEPTGQIVNPWGEFPFPFIHYMAFCGTDDCDNFNLYQASYDCEESCSNFEVVLTALELVPVGGLNWEGFQPGGILEGSINGTTPDGTSLDIQFRKTY